MADVSAISAPPPRPQTPPKVYSAPVPRSHDVYQSPGALSRENPSSPSRHTRKPVPLPSVQLGEGTIGSAPSSPIKVEHPEASSLYQPQSAQIEEHGSQLSSRSVSATLSARGMTPSPDPSRLSPSIQTLPIRRPPSVASAGNPLAVNRRSYTGNFSPYQTGEGSEPHYTPNSSAGHSSQNSLDHGAQQAENYQPLQYFHQPYENGNSGRQPDGTQQHRASGAMRRNSRGQVGPRPDSRVSSGSEFALRGREHSPGNTPDSHVRARSTHSLGVSPDIRPQSYVDLLNVPYPQPPPVSLTDLDNTNLRKSVGNNASLLSTAQTLEMYRANVKKTNDPAIQYEFAVFMITCAQEAAIEESQRGPGASPKAPGTTRAELLKEARHILQRLSDRSYPFAQYYLADGYASGLFSKDGEEDYDKAFPLFVSASKHGHAEAGYRAALCYEFGWGTKIEAGKAVQFYRQSASKNHPGAMLRLGRACISGDLGLGKRYREGVKWLKRAAESADFQYNSAPYDLGVLHETGYGDDIFQDESYAAQLFTKSADLGHPDANYRLGDAYEHGKLTCPRDPALSVHFYTGAAQRGHPLAMMALCAWYMVGAEPVLEKDEGEAYEWAKRAAQAGLSKAQYCLGYFTETGIGCRRDPLEANVWYVRAAEQGDERAKHRLEAIRKASMGVDPVLAAAPPKGKNLKGQKHEDSEEHSKKKKFGIF